MDYINKWLEDKKVLELQYTPEELSFFISHAKKCGGWKILSERMADQFLRSQKKDFYHNLALIKLAAFLRGQEFFDIKFLITKNERSADIVASHESGHYAIELKQKVEMTAREKYFDSWFIESAESCSKEGYRLADLEFKNNLVRKTEKELEEELGDLKKTIINHIEANKSSVKHVHKGLFTYELEKCSEKCSKGHAQSTHRRPSYPYLEQWKPGGRKLLDKAYGQIEASKQKYPEITGGIVVVDLTGLRFNMYNAKIFANEQLRNKPIPTKLIIMRSPGMQEPGRRDFASDFFIC